MSGKDRDHLPRLPSETVEGTRTVVRAPRTCVKGKRLTPHPGKGSTRTTLSPVDHSLGPEGSERVCWTRKNSGGLFRRTDQAEWGRSGVVYVGPRRGGDGSRVLTRPSLHVPTPSSDTGGPLSRRNLLHDDVTVPRGL